MVGTKRRYFWIAALTAYWLSACWLLFRVFPIFVDSSGATASFHWGRTTLAASLFDYQQNSRTRLLFLCPYWVGASIITLAGCGLTSWLVERWTPKGLRLFLVSSATTLSLLLLTGAVSEAGIALQAWKGPSMYNSFGSVLAFLEVFVPMSLLSGVLAIARIRPCN